MNSAITLTLPGWQGAGTSHWLELWERTLGFERVQQHDWLTPLRGDWITRLEDVILSKDTVRPFVLVAHGLGCHLVAAWAAVSRNAARVHAALLVAPPDVGRPDFPPEAHSWRRPVLTRLPFAATCVGFSDDPHCSVDAGRRMASSWGAHCVALAGPGPQGEAGALGDWPRGQDILKTALAKRQPEQFNESKELTWSPKN